MADNETGGTAREGGVDFVGLFRIAWSRKWLVGGAATATAMVTLVATLFLPDVYRAETLLEPKAKQESGLMSTLAAQYGGLASLAGMELSGTGSDRVQLGMKVLKSRQFVFKFIQERDILVELMAARGWDRKSGQLEIDPRVYSEDDGRWVRKARPPRMQKPSLQEAHEEFLDILVVGYDKSSGFLTLGIHHYSPDLASTWVNWLAQDLNRDLMEREVAEARQAIEFLQQQVQSTSSSEMHEVFYRLIEDQMKVVMLANSNPDYAFRIIDPAVPPELKAGPMRAVMVLLAFLLGGMLGVTVAVLRARPRVASPDMPHD